MKSLGFSLQGKDHVSSGTPCQDYHAIFHLNDDCVIAIVADGVGSAKLSDVGAKVASETVLEFLKSNLQTLQDDEAIMNILEEAYQKAFDQITSLAKDFRANIEEFDTTLTTTIITSKKTFYGHSGDGGIILLLENGIYEKLTLPQKGKAGGSSVIPLRFSDQWEFGVTEEPIYAVLLATDGIYDTFFPPLIQSQPISIYVHRIEQFMNIPFPLDVEIHRQKCIVMTDTPTIRDDRTMVLIIHESRSVQRQQASYYAIPDWTSLQKQALKDLYPNLSEDEINAFMQVRNEQVTEKNDIETQPTQDESLPGLSDDPLKTKDS